jgi:hypothetical protein
VFAMGDPWVYNEYINSKDNKPTVTNVMKWLLGQTTRAVPFRAALQKQVPGTSMSASLRMVLPNGRLIPSTNLKRPLRGAHGIACISAGKAGARQYSSVR